MLIHETLKNNERIDTWYRKARPAALEQHREACDYVKEIWSTAWPAEAKAYALRRVRRTVPAEAMFEINLLIGMLENYL